MIPCAGDLSTPEGRTAIEGFLSAFMGDEQRGPLAVLSSPGHSFSDVAKKVVSFINLASTDDLGRTLNAEVDPIRFRGNVHLCGARCLDRGDLARPHIRRSGLTRNSRW